MRNRITVVAVLVSALLWSSSAMAQGRHVVDPSAMRQAVAAQAATDQQNRDVVRQVLRQSQTREIASRLGLSLKTAENAVSTLSSADLARLAIPARAANTANTANAANLAGGDRMIVISLTTLLLIIIVVLLIAR